MILAHIINSTELKDAAKIVAVGSACHDGSTNLAQWGTSVHVWTEPGATCYELAGHALCLPWWWFPSPTPPSPPVVGCDQLRCANCMNDPKTGEGICIPPPVGCGSMECAHCVEDDKGNGKCVSPPTPPTNPCDLLRCVQCEVQADGTAKCVSPFPPTPPVGCEAMTCPVGTSCTNDSTGQGRCSNPCDLLRYVQCEVQADGTAKCLSPDA